MLRVFLVLFLVTFTGAAYAAEDCRELFVAQHSIERFTSFHLEEVARTQGRFGGSVLTIKRRETSYAGESAQWYLFPHDPEFIARPGDIRWVAAYLTPPIKSVLSVQSLSNEYKPVSHDSESLYFMVVPDAHEVRGAISSLQSAAKSAFGSSQFQLINFFVADGVVSPREYLERFAQKMELPIAADGYVFEHDLNSHVLSAFYTPSRLALAMQRRARILLLFEKFLKNKIAEERSQVEALAHVPSKIEHVVAEQVVEFMDLQANIVGAYKAKEQRDTKVQEAVLEVLNVSRSPSEFLEKIFSETRLGPRYLGARKFKQEFDRVYSEFKAQLPREYTEADVPDTWFHDAKSVVMEVEQQFHAVENLSRLIHWH